MSRRVSRCTSRRIAIIDDEPAIRDNLRDARAAVGAAERVRRETAGLSRREAGELWSGLRDDIPPGYEAVVGAYYRRVTGGIPPTPRQ
mgnify:CR=1 FL=1